MIKDNIEKTKFFHIDVYNRIKDKSEDEFIRLVGVNQERFEFLLLLINAKIKEEQTENKMKLRGLKSYVSLENQLLIFFFYIRDYPTFIKLGLSFGLSESYVFKLYEKMATYILKVLKLPPKTKIKDLNITQLAVDVTEQPIERPILNQKKYFSGKKKDTQ
jgi:hypothetical protein